MTAAVANSRAARDRREVASFAAVIVLLVVALAAGLLVRMSVERAVQPVEQAGLNAQLPAGWIIMPAAGDRLLTAYDPLDPDLRYGVAAVDPAGMALTPEDAAARRLRDRGRLLQGFAVASQGPGALGAVPTYEVRYGFVDQAPGGAPTTIEAVEHYFADGPIFPEDRILAVILEAPTGALNGALPDFERFAGEIAGRAGTATVAPAPVIAAGAGGPRLASLSGGEGGTPASPAATADLVNGTVQILMVATIGGQEQAYGWGSGTIISSTGLILTNAHVAKPSAPGLGVYEADPTPSVDPEDLIVAVIEAEDRPAVPRYRATVLSADGYLDAAVIQIDRDLSGARLATGSLKLPTVPIGASDALHTGDPLTVIGFPGIGGDTISLSAGRVSGFLGDDRIGPRAWVKTDAVISSGNSGGLAANAAGELIGIPTRAPSDAGGYSWVRPVALVMPLIEGARAGRRTVDSPYLVAGTGRETIKLDSWTDNSTDCPARNRVTAYPSGTANIIASLQHGGFTSGQDLVSQWRLDGEIVSRGGFRFAPGAESGGCYFSELYYDRGLPDGSYFLEVFVGPTLRPMTTAQTTIGAAGRSGAATLAGVVQDSDSGRPVAGAVVFMLVPGTDIQTWFNNPQESQIVSFAKAGSDGRFLVNGLTAGNSYPGMAMADGYLASGGTVGPMLEGANTMAGPIALAPVAP